MTKERREGRERSKGKTIIKETIDLWLHFPLLEVWLEIFHLIASYPEM
jgi:hypothetical protein